MLFAIVVLTSCNSPENAPLQKQKSNGNLSGIELEFDTTVVTDTINLD